MKKSCPVRLYLIVGLHLGNMSSLVFRFFVETGVTKCVTLEFAHTFANKHFITYSWEQKGPPS